MDKYIQDCLRTEAPLSPAVDSRLHKAARLIHAAFGFTTEAGEFTDQLKRWVYYDKEPDFINLMEEIGDLFWYASIAIDEIEFLTGQVFGFSEVQRRNIEKLRKRFPDKFTKENAIERNLDEERKELEFTPVLDGPGRDIPFYGLDDPTVDQHPLIKNKDGDCYFLMRLSVQGDDEYTNWCRQIVKKWCKDAYYKNDKIRRVGQEIKSIIDAIEDDVRTKNARNPK